MTKHSLQHEIIKINIKSNVRLYLRGWRTTRGCGARRRPCSLGFEIITAPRPRYLDVDDDTWQYATIPRRCVWVSGGAGTSEARTHTARAQSGRALTRRRGHTRARGTRTRNPRCTTPIEETTVWLRWKIRWFRPKFREKTSLFKLSFQNQTKINFILFSERLLFLFPARI